MRKLPVLALLVFLVACSRADVLPEDVTATGVSTSRAAFDPGVRRVAGTTIPADDPLELVITLGRALPSGSEFAVSIPTAVQEEADTLWSIPTLDPNVPGSVRIGRGDDASVELVEARRIAGGAGRIVARLRKPMDAGATFRIGLTGNVPQIVPTTPFRIVERDGATGQVAALSPTSVQVAPVVAADAVWVNLSIASDTTVGESSEMIAAALDQFGNVDREFRGTVALSTDLAGCPATYSFTEADAGRHVFPGLHAGRAGIHRVALRCTLAKGELNVASNPQMAWAAAPPFRRYFGDAHFHSGSDVDTLVTPGGDHRGQFTDSAAAFAYLRDVAGLDWGVSAEHDTGLSRTTWLENQRRVDALNQAGRFVTLLGYEWTPNRRIGHHVVIFGDGPADANALVTATTGKRGKGAATVTDLAAAVGAGGGSRVLIVPHVMQPFPNGDTDKDDHALPHEIWDGPPGTAPGGYVFNQARRVGEIYSHHNDDYTRDDYRQTTLGRGDSVNQPQLFELGVHNPWSYQHAWATGHRIGVIGGSDNHLGTPGINDYAPTVPQHSGLAVVLAPELSRGAVFDALYARRCYATTGARILLAFDVDGMPMGSELVRKAGANISLHVEVAGTAPLTAVEVVTFVNGDFMVVKSAAVDGSAPDATLTFSEPVEGPTIYYVRVRQADGEMAWSSPVWVN